VTDGSQAERVPVSVVGMGNMGRALAGALIDAGHPVMVWNRSAGASDALVARGARRAESVAAALRFAELIIVCVVDHAATREILAADGAHDAVAGRTLVQFSHGSPDDAAELETWSLRSGARFLQGSIKVYPSDIGSPAALLTYAGARDTFEASNTTLVAFGKAVYVGESVAVASALADAGALIFEIATAAFFELAAYVTAHGAEAKDLASMVASSLRFTVSTVQGSVEQLDAGTFDGHEASIAVHASGLRTATDSIVRSGHDPRLARATLSYLEDAEAAGAGALDIGALLTTVGAPGAARPS
jgi:3-hydroxyisobutyrate dehydrogenase-like beta-hydroxyacid dehydrogenase